LALSPQHLACEQLGAGTFEGHGQPVVFGERLLDSAVGAVDVAPGLSSRLPLRSSMATIGSASDSLPRWINASAASGTMRGHGRGL
jgi:hypothetical protein